MEYTDKTLQCRDCGADFIFTAGEQEFYAEKGFTNEPGRCNDCRSRRRRERSGGNREMHTAICAECGAETQVPFKPTTGKPVYCSACFTRR
ncbi:MAG TPA: zinc-binding protein [Firmicutes bacterium]|nr:zinc-ribbon domain containing protein [Eubacteriales bacterium]HBI56928.1 zinc-binding protein [Bacillota bacterium]